MKNPSDRQRQKEELRAKILGMGDRSIRKSYYPALREQMEALERYRELLDQALNAICLLSFPDLHFVDCNRSACTLFGFTPDEQTARRLAEVIDSASAERIERWLGSPGWEVDRHLRLEARISGGERAMAQVELSLSWVEFHGTGYLVCVAQDITERKSGEKALRRSLAESRAAKTKLDAILRSVADGLLVVGSDRRISLMNLTAEEYLGLSFREARWRPVEEALREKGLCEQILATLEGEERVLVGELELGTRADGYPRIFRAKTGPIVDESGRRAGAITTLREVTRERELDRMKDEFISTAAHELRTPLTSVIGFAELLIDQEQFGPFSGGQQRQFLETIYAKSQALSAIVDDLLDLSRVQAGQLIALNRRQGDLCRLVEAMVESYRQAFSGHHFALQFTDCPLVVLLDEKKIGQLLENLLSNAVKFSPVGSTIKVVGAVRGDYAEIRIEDQGIGMSDEQQQRIFDKFYRADASDTAASGLGLGMAIARQIVLAHGGLIRVESTPGEGTVVRFTLPLE